MNKSLYKLIIFIGMLGLISSCSDDDSESKSQYEVVDNVVTSWYSPSHYEKQYLQANCYVLGRVINVLYLIHTYQ